MITFDTDITLYSKWAKGRDEKWVRTHILGASWHGGQAVTVDGSGLITADKYAVRILAGSMGNYVTPDEWNALEAAPEGRWTVQAGDVAVKGIVTDEVTTGITQITSKYTNCFVVTGTSDNRRIALKHLKIEGK